MLFNSLSYAVFLPLVFLLYWWLSGNIKKQNLFLLVVSYFFYGCWDWRFLSLILLSSATDFFVGKALGRAESPHLRKRLLAVSLIINLGLLGVFKYYNFFVSTFVDFLEVLGFTASPTLLEIILPVGISFYTFQTLSYTFDVYNRKISPTHDWLSFFTFVAFFPQLVAGPIERASRLLPQFQKPRIFSRVEAISGLRLILWGLFKKVAIADTLGVFVDTVYGTPSEYSGATTLLAIVFFTIQVYCDFSGYSDIAIGSARLLGIRLMTNFRSPYLTFSIRDFWDRWHISLSTWFRDYIYFPLGGNRGTYISWIRNIFAIFLISGLWHGASLNFVIWGFILGATYLIEAIAVREIRFSMPKAFRWFYTIGVFAITLVFFRATDLSHTMEIFSRIVETGKGIMASGIFSTGEFAAIFISVASLFFVEILAGKEDATEWIGRQKQVIRWGIYYALIIWILLFGTFDNPQQFIYFQF